MWIQTMAVQPASAVGKGSQGAQRNGTAAATETDFAAWLDASLNQLEEDSPGTPAASVEKSGVFAAQDNLSEETLLNVLQEWLAASMQPVLSGKSSEENGQALLVRTPSPLETTLAEDVTARLSGIAHLNADSTAGRTENGDLPQQLQQIIQRLSTMQDIRLLESGHEPNVERLNEILTQWLQAARLQSGPVSDLPVDGLDAPFWKEIRNVLLSSDGAELTIVDMPTVDGEKTGTTPLGNVREILVREGTNQLGIRTGMSQDGGGALQENGRSTQPIVNGGPTQGAAGIERSFSQWLNQTILSETTEANPSSPVREANPVFPTVRLILTRFETLDGRGYEARFQLYPEHLGTVHVKLVFHQGALQAHLVVDTRMAKEALESQLQHLQQAFAQQGLQVDKIEVTVREDALFQWQEQNAFLYQEQRQQGRDAQGGSSSGSSGGYMMEEVEEGTTAPTSPIHTSSSPKNGIDLSI